MSWSDCEDYNDDEDWERPIYQGVITEIEKWGDPYYPSPDVQEKTGFFTTEKEALLDTLVIWKDMFRDVINVNCIDCIERLLANDKDKRWTRLKCKDQSCSNVVPDGLVYLRKRMLQMIEDADKDGTGYIYPEGHMETFFGTQTDSRRLEFDMKKYYLRKNNELGVRHYD